MMKTKIIAVDEHLKKLADYKPQEQPDWDSFYTEYLNTISGVAGSNKKSSSHLKISGILKSTLMVLIAASGIIIGYVLIIDKNTSTDSPAFEQTYDVTNVSGDSAEVLNTSNFRETNTIPVAKIATASSASTQDSLQNTALPAYIPNKTILPETSASIPDITPKEHVSDSTSPNLLKELTSDSTDLTAEKPVILKKTVIIYDTLKIVRPHKN